MWILAVIVLVAALGALLYALYRRMTADWPRPRRRAPEHKPKPNTWREEGLYISWLGHSTLLMQLDGMRVITDPVLFSRVGVRALGWTFGPRRHVECPIGPEACGQVDLVLLSHAHMDHLDHASLRRLVTRETIVVTPRGTGYLTRWHRPKAVHELRPGEILQLEDGTEIAAVEVRHWGSRYPWNRNMGYQGYVIRRDGWSVFFAGDTAATDLSHVRAFEPQIACMPIGAYAPEPFENAHCTPEQAWDMFLQTGAQVFLPIHHDTFVLSREPVDEPLQRLLAVADDERVWAMRHGETYYVKSPKSIEKPKQLD